MNTPTPSLTITSGTTTTIDPKMASKLAANQIAALTAQTTGVRATVEDADSRTKTHYRPTSDSRGDSTRTQLSSLQNPLAGNLQLIVSQPQTPTAPQPTTARSSSSAVLISNNGSGAITVSTRSTQNAQAGQRPVSGTNEPTFGLNLHIVGA